MSAASFCCRRDVDGRREGAVLVRVDGGGVGGRGERAGDETHQGQVRMERFMTISGVGVTGRFQAGPVGDEGPAELPTCPRAVDPRQGVRQCLP